MLSEVVASTIFIEDNKLLKGCTFWCILLIIVLKIITNKLSRKYTGQKLQKFMENAQLAVKKSKLEISSLQISSFRQIQARSCVLAFSEHYQTIQHG
jgi:hypothetical protein